MSNLSEGNFTQVKALLDRAVAQTLRCFVFSFVVATGVALSSPASAENISGTYVGSSSNGAFLVEIVQIDGGQLTGRYRQVLLKPSGQIADTNAALSGAIDNGMVVITIEPTDFLSASITISGTFDGQALRLSGGRNGATISLNLINADEGSFRAQVANLTDKANQIRQAKLEADAVVKMESFIKSMEAFSAHSAAQLGLFAPTEQKLKAITAQMHSALERQRAIIGIGEADVARGQISVWINQAEIEASQIYGSVDAAYRDFDSKSGPFLTKLASAVPGCEAVVSGAVAASDSQNVDRWKSACGRLLDNAEIFQAHVVSLRKSFTRFAAVWDEQHEQQVAIVRASDADAR